MPSNIGNKKPFSEPKQEKYVRVELVSKYTTGFGDYVIHTEYFSYPARLLKRPDWGEYIANDWFFNEDLFPSFKDLEFDGYELPSSLFEVYTVDENNIRNGRAQGIRCYPKRWLLLWEAQFKNGEQHGKCIDYDYEIRVKRKASKSFHTDGMPDVAKTVAEWRKKQAEMRALAKTTQIRKK